MNLTRLITAPVLLMFLLVGCHYQSGKMYDGHYTAEAADYNVDGWKDYITIYVFDGRIGTVECNARNRSGFLRSWDLNYQRRVEAETGSHPGEYMRHYLTELRNLQDPAKVLAVRGAEQQHRIFQLLAAAVIAQARTGAHEIVVVDIATPNKEKP